MKVEITEKDLQSGLSKCAVTEDGDIMIPACRKKQTFYTLQLLGYWGFCMMLVFIGCVHNETGIPLILGVILIACSSPLCLFAIYRIWANKGIAISDNWIIELSDPKIRILWEDIANILCFGPHDNNGPTSCLLIAVKNPEEYIFKYRSIFRRFWAKKNYKFCGTPLYMHTAYLKCNISETWCILQNELDKRKQGGL